MKVLNIMCCYNELEYIPKVIRYYEASGIDVYVLDNYSTDGTWEWLNDNNITCEQFNTEQCFDLNTQQQIRKNTAIKHSEYEWIIYGDADEYIVCEPELLDVFTAASDHACNIIRMKSFDIYNTGEQRPSDVDITRTYFYYLERYNRFNGITRIYKNTPNVKFSGDFINVPNMKVCSINTGNVLNYGCTKTAEQREDTYERRVRAWDSGLVPRGHGTHYIENKRRGWKWPAEELLSMRNHKDWKFIKPKVVDFI